MGPPVGKVTIPNNKTNPYRVPKGMFNCEEDLYVTGMHSIRINDFFVYAKYLNLKQIQHYELLKYYHIEIDDFFLFCAGSWMHQRLEKLPLIIERSFLS